jgi:hypothetical protein
VTSTQKPEEALKSNYKHLEIRNNRYVLTDNISAIDKKDAESNDMSFNFDATEMKKQKSEEATI